MTGDRAVYDDGVLRITNTDDPPGLVIAGEIDESTYPGLVGALDRVTDGPAEIHLSLGGVSYCDLAGLRAIVGVTGGSGGRPRNGFGHSKRVVLHEVPPQLRNVLQIVGWDSTPGLALDRPDAGTLPGQAGTLPGQAGTLPGQAGTLPGQAGTLPGQAGTLPGQAGTLPGQAGPSGSDRQGSAVW